MDLMTSCNFYMRGKFFANSDVQSIDSCKKHRLNKQFTRIPLPYTLLRCRLKPLQIHVLVKNSISVYIYILYLPHEPAITHVPSAQLPVGICPTLSGPAGQYDRHLDQSSLSDLDWCQIQDHHGWKVYCCNNNGETDSIFFSAYACMSTCSMSLQVFTSIYCHDNCITHF